MYELRVHINLPVAAFFEPVKKIILYTVVYKKCTIDYSIRT